MIVRVIDIYVIEDRLDDFQAAMLKNHKSSIQEPGVIRFDVLKDVDDPSHFILYEVYSSDESTNAHKQTSHYAEWKAAVEPMMAKGRTFTACRPVAPLDAEMW